MVVLKGVGVGETFISEIGEGVTRVAEVLKPKQKEHNPVASNRLH